MKEPIQAENPDERVVDRRAFLSGAASLIALSATQAVAPALAAQPLQEPRVPEDPTLVPGSPATQYGARSRFEHSQRRARTQRSVTPLQDLHGIVTPSALHFERHHNGVPLIDPARHRLLIHGLVDRPLMFTIEDLKRFPAVSRLAFIECSGNSGHEWPGPRGASVQDTHGLLSTSEWTGVPLATVLNEVGVRDDARWMLVEGSDAAAMTRSLPLADIIDETLLCYAQNGEALRPEQGYPLRLLIPGWEGNTCIKWLRRLKLGTAPFMTREETARYTDLMPDGTAHQFTLAMDAKSVITTPSPGQRTKPGFVEITGLAWSGRCEQQPSARGAEELQAQGERRAEEDPAQALREVRQTEEECTHACSGKRSHDPAQEQEQDSPVGELLGEGRGEHGGEPGLGEAAAPQLLAEGIACTEGTPGLDARRAERNSEHSDGGQERGRAELGRPGDPQVPLGQGAHPQGGDDRVGDEALVGEARR